MTGLNAGATLLEAIQQRLLTDGIAVLAILDALLHRCLFGCSVHDFAPLAENVSIS
jgi:hypothetical protein